MAAGGGWRAASVERNELIRVFQNRLQRQQQQRRQKNTKKNNCIDTRADVESIEIGRKWQSIIDDWPVRENVDRQPDGGAHTQKWIFILMASLKALLAALNFYV